MRLRFDFAVVVAVMVALLQVSTARCQPSSDEAGVVTAAKRLASEWEQKFNRPTNLISRSGDIYYIHKYLVSSVRVDVKKTNSLINAIIVEISVEVLLGDNYCSPFIEVYSGPTYASNGKKASCGGFRSGASAKKHVDSTDFGEDRQIKFYLTYVVEDGFLKMDSYDKLFGTTYKEFLLPDNDGAFASLIRFKM
jgi:hypothetical protein